MTHHTMLDPEESSSLPSQEDYESIVESVRNYAEGWYDGDAERMRRALHPELVKRTVERGPTPGTWKLRPPVTFDMMIRATQDVGGTEVPPSQRHFQIDVLHIFRHIAIARCVSPLYVDYLQLAKTGERKWLIVHALWEARKGRPEGQ